MEATLDRAADAAMLVSLLPAVMHVRGVERLSVLVRLVGEESMGRRSGRDLVLQRLVEVLLIEALRSTSGEESAARALARPRRRAAHPGDPADASPNRAFLDDGRAREGGACSRSAFFERFVRVVGIAPMEYLIAWRMAVAEDLLRREDLGLAEIADRVGCLASASAFRHRFHASRRATAESLRARRGAGSPITRRCGSFRLMSEPQGDQTDPRLSRDRRGAGYPLRGVRRSGRAHGGCHREP